MLTDHAQSCSLFHFKNVANNKDKGHFHATALFVDISGFSALTDQLMAHGQHGAEVLAGVMGEIFEPLIDAVYSQGGVVTGFAGDAFTAVFPHTNSPSTFRALAAAVTIQKQMQSRPEQNTPYGRYTMSAKVGVAGGEVIWGIVSAEDGQQASYYFQGTAIDGCAEAEHAARPGEIILDKASFEAVRNRVAAEAIGGHYRLTAVTAPLPAPQSDPHPTMNMEQLLRFVPQAVVRAGRTGEFRQVVNMFISLPTVRTEAQLDIFMQTVFNLQRQYGGLLKLLDYGDKGAKLLLFWGAPVAHENDIQRALHFILNLQTQTAIPINGGLTYHVAHAGYIGSSLRGEYTCYGRGVNLAARFMTGAPRGEIWVDEHIARRAGGQFDLEFEGEKSFKGFVDPQKVYILFERMDSTDNYYDGQLVGRETDLTRLGEFIAPIYHGRSPGMFVIWGEPGAGKSRLANEFLTRYLQPGTETQVFLAQTDEILRQSLNPFRYWPDSLYEQVDAKDRQEHILSGLTALLQAESHRQPAVLLLEDAHWIDQDSSAFLSALLTTLAQSEGEQIPLAVLATARYEGNSQPLEGVSYREINLSALNPADLATFTQAHLDAPPSFICYKGKRTRHSKIVPPPE